MRDETSHTLEELACHFRLTRRTARHYIEHVLPPHHKTGRGRRARYGSDTWNCFAFIRRARRDRLTMAQISNLLATLGQSQIDQVVQGLEELAIVPTTVEPIETYSSPCMAGEFAEAPQESRRRKHMSRDGRYESNAGAIAEGSEIRKTGESAEPIARWQVLYTDEELQITHRGQASPHQREQVRMAAAYIKRILAASE